MKSVVSLGFDNSEKGDVPVHFERRRGDPVVALRLSNAADY